MIGVITMVERKENWPVRTYTHENLHTICGYQEMVQMAIINKHPVLVASYWLLLKETYFI